MVDYGLAGKVAVVTGGGSGIGLETARALLEQGAEVAIGDLRPPGPEAFPDRRPLGVEVDFLRADAADQLVGAAVAQFGRVDVVVNNVGVLDARESFLAVSDEDWRRSIELNVLAMVRTSRAAIPHLLDAGGGSIVNIASNAARQPIPICVDYAMAKAAVMSVSKSLSIEFGPQGIRSNCIAPGPTRTPALAPFLDSLAQDLGLAREQAERHFVEEMLHLPLGRLNDPGHVAAVVLFLASERSAQVTGSVYAVDAGAVVGVA